MKTRYDLGAEVGIKGRVLSISVTTSGVEYEVNVNDISIRFKEDELSDIIDFSDADIKAGDEK